MHIIIILPYSRAESIIFVDRVYVDACSGRRLQTDVCNILLRFGAIVANIVCCILGVLLAEQSDYVILFTVRESAIIITHVIVLVIFVDDYCRRARR